MKAIIGVFFIVLLSIGTPWAATQVPTLDKDELKSMLDSADLVLIDVRTGSDWSTSELQIQGAVREEPADVAAWADNYGKDKTLVLYCA